MLLNKLTFQRGEIPEWLKSNVQYLTIMGSEAYGCATDTSDKDIYGIVIPPKNLIQSDNLLLGFDEIPVFNQWQKHHHEENGFSYDFSIYSITRYFKLLLENNPNMLDSIFTPDRCVLFSTFIGQKIKQNRHLFLSKQCFYKMQAYAMSQLHKLDRKPEGKRVAIVEKYGFDVKYASHAYRIVSECENILIDHDLDLEKHKETLKSIRRGDWALQQIKDWFYDKNKYIEELYRTSTLRNKPDATKIRELLVECIESHYGTVTKSSDSQILDAMRQINSIINNVRVW